MITGSYLIVYMYLKISETTTQKILTWTRISHFKKLKRSPSLTCSFSEPLKLPYGKEQFAIIYQKNKNKVAVYPVCLI
jgi:hypothetical protein